MKKNLKQLCERPEFTEQEIEQEEVKNNSLNYSVLREEFDKTLWYIIEKKAAGFIYL